MNYTSFLSIIKLLLKVKFKYTSKKVANRAIEALGIATLDKYTK
jgi:hypothetical protein